MGREDKILTSIGKIGNLRAHSVNKPDVILKVVLFAHSTNSVNVSDPKRSLKIIITNAPTIVKSINKSSIT